MLAAKIFDALVPARCPVCAVRVRGGGACCADCRELLPWIVAACEVCGAELFEAGVCGACQTRPPYYDRALIPFKYRAPIAGQIQTLKYQRQLRHAGALAAMICRRAWQDPSPPPDVLVPVPLHKKRLRERGFNQALEIARKVGGELGIEVSRTFLARIKNTVPQVGLGHLERRRNVKGAFQVTDNGVGGVGANGGNGDGDGGVSTPPHIALIDDVVTSGSTVNAAARALKRAGVTTVSVWAAAKT